MLPLARLRVGIRQSIGRNLVSKSRMMDYLITARTGRCMPFPMHTRRFYPTGRSSAFISNCAALSWVDRHNDVCPRMGHEALVTPGRHGMCLNVYRNLFRDGQVASANYLVIIL